MMDKLARYPVTAIQINCGDDGLDHIGEQGAFAPPAGFLFTTPDAQIVAEPEAACDARSHGPTRGSTACLVLVRPDWMYSVRTPAPRMRATVFVGDRCMS